MTSSGVDFGGLVLGSCRDFCVDLDVALRFSLILPGFDFDLVFDFALASALKLIPGQAYYAYMPIAPLNSPGTWGVRP